LSEISVARAWAAVHATRPALNVVAVTAVASWVLAQTYVQNLGVIQLFAAISVMLLLPAVAGVAAATACYNEAGVPLPDPTRAAVARGLWALAWTALATAAALVGQLAGAEVTPAATVRNMLIYTGIGLIAVRAGFPQLVWLPVLTYTVACMMFGYPSGEPRYYWWAVVMEEAVSSSQLVWAAAWYAVALVGYVVRFGGYRMR
jgi:hypothetical protein